MISRNLLGKKHPGRKRTFKIPGTRPGKKSKRGYSRTRNGPFSSEKKPISGGEKKVCAYTSRKTQRYGWKASQKGKLAARPRGRSAEKVYPGGGGKFPNSDGKKNFGDEKNRREKGRG